MKWLLNFTRIPEMRLKTPLVLNCDNQGTILLSANNVHFKRTKHIDLKYHFIRNFVNEEIVKIQYVPTQSMTADILTKSLPFEKFLRFRKALGLVWNYRFLYSKSK